MKIPLAFRRLLIYNNRAVTRRGENRFQPIKIPYATVAQLVEQLIRNQQVGGSSPPSSSIQIKSELFPIWEKFGFFVFTPL